MVQWLLYTCLAFFRLHGGIEVPPSVLQSFRDTYTLTAHESVQHWAQAVVAARVSTPEQSLRHRRGSQKTALTDPVILKGMSGHL